jgi:hypothetical protein
MGQDGTLYISTLDGHIYAIGPGPGASVSGNVNLEDYVADTTQIPVNIQLRLHDGGNTIPLISYLASDGSYSLPDIPAGNYDIAFKASHWLQSVTSNVNVQGTAATGPSVSLLNGDVNGDNVVEDQDYSLMGVAWYSSVGDPNYNVNADLNGDGSVEDQDYSIMGLNWYKSGDVF